LQGLLAQSDLSPYQRRWYQGLLSSFHAYLGIPLLVNDQVFGGLVFYFQVRRIFSREDIQLAETLAGHAALAIENARLRHQAAEIAKLAERSRLARDLHDAVTQTLFSAGLIADVLPALWERNPELGRQKLAELRLLTRGALSEMRTLLLELRPDTLADVELGDLYRHLANAFSGRTRVPVDLVQDGQALLPPDVKEVFYRVAQEALNNIAKHANASAVQLRLNAQPGWVEVAIRDNGDGFDTTEVTPENLGLKIMRERAEAIGARLSIDSRPGEGTRIELVWRKT
jgi:signal transduction histidine kinase